MGRFAHLDSRLAINPGETQVQAFSALDPARPVMFVNLHRYHERARYPAGVLPASMPADVSGREAYHRYLREIEARFLPKVGARFIVVSPVDLVLVGAGSWDEVVIGCYPTRASAFELPALPGYAEIAVHREAGLAAALTLALGETAFSRLPEPGSA